MRAALGHQVEAAPARQLGDRVRRQESCAGTHRTGRGARLGAAEQLALTWARVALARRGLPAGSPVLLLALPLAFAFFALRHLSEDERSTQTRVGDGEDDARQVWSKGLQKSLSPEGKTSGQAARGCRLSPTERGVDSITWSLRYVSGCLGDTLVSQVPPLPVLEWSRSGGLSRSLTTRRGKGAHSPGLRSHLSAAAAAALRSAPAARAARSSHKFWGSPSRLFFNSPQVGRRRLLRTLPSPRPLPLPHHTPTPRRRHATGRSLSWAIAAQPLSSSSPGKGLGRPSPAAAGNSRQGSLEAALTLSSSLPDRTEQFGEARKGPWCSQSLAGCGADLSLEKCVGGVVWWGRVGEDGEKFATLVPAPQ